MWKCYVKNNYLFLENGDLVHRKPKKKITVFKDSIASDRYFFKVPKDFYLVIKLADLVDENDNPFTKESFDEFITLNTGTDCCTSQGSGVENTITVDVKGNLVVPEVTKDNLIFGYIHSTAKVPIIPTGTFDTDNLDPTSIRHPRLIDGSTVDVNYNYLAGASTTNLNFYGQDLGVAKKVDIYSLYWWLSSTAYNAIDFRIEATNDLNTPFIPIVENLSSVGLTAWQDIEIPPETPPYRYWRVHCIQGVNPAYLVITEANFFNTAPKYIDIEDNSLDYSFNANGELELINLTGEVLTITLRYK